MKEHYPQIAGIIIGLIGLLRQFCAGLDENYSKKTLCKETQTHQEFILIALSFSQETAEKGNIVPNRKENITTL